MNAKERRYVKAGLSHLIADLRSKQDRLDFRFTPDPREWRRLQDEVEYVRELRERI